MELKIITPAGYSQKPFNPKDLGKPGCTIM